MKTPHLPLPPPLPWSPHSHQFHRHLQILSLALLGKDADESWGIYEALFPDLRQAIPDDVFVSLIAHQARGKVSDTASSRLMELVTVARSCGMDPLRLKTTVLLSVIKAVVHQAPYSDYWTAEAYDSLDWLWNSLVARDDGMLKRSSLQLRQNWLAVMSFRYQADLAKAQGALEELVENGGGHEITKVAATVILAQSKKVDEQGLRESLRLAAWCLARDVPIQRQTVSLLLTRLRRRVVAEGGDGRGSARKAAQDLIHQLEEGGAVEPARKFQQSLDHFLVTSRSRRERAEDTLHDVNATAPMLRKAADKLLAGEQPPHEDLDLVVKLCNRTLQVSDYEYDDILRVAVRHIRHHPDLAVALVRDALHANVFRRQPVSSRSKWVLLESLISAIANPNAYTTARQLYGHARVEKNTWKACPALWRRFFDSAVKHGNVWFASRLYADFQADGLVVPRACMLGFIHLVASRPSRSRSILLERYIKDYMYDDEHPTKDLILAVTQGLVKTGSYDAESAVYIAKRLDKTLPVEAVELVMRPLAASPKQAHRQLALALLQEVPPADASRSYALAITGLFHCSRDQVSLVDVLAVFHNMIKRDVPVTVEVASVMVAVLVQSGRLDSALSVFNAAADAHKAIKSSAMGRLMVNLALADRCDEAYAAESRWRGLFPDGVDYDKGVRGARLVVDVKAGLEVDLSAYEGAEADVQDVDVDGYQPNKPFLRFIKRIQLELDQADQATQAEQADAVAENSAAAEPSEPHAVSGGRGWMRGGSQTGDGVQMGGLMASSMTVTA